MANQISNQFLTLADGYKIPQEGFGLYKITDPLMPLNGHMKPAIACSTQHRCMKTKNLSVKGCVN